MKYDPALHHRRSIRLRGYDYSQAGAYFITICTRHRRCIFGHVENQEMVLNEYGQVAYQEWEKLPERWPHVELGAFQIMPNHVHGIIIIRDVASPVGAPLAGALATDHVADHVVGVPARGTPTTDHVAGVQKVDPVDDPTTTMPTTTMPVAAAPTTGVPARGTPTTDHVAGVQNVDPVDDPATTMPVAAAHATGVPARGTPTNTETNVPTNDPANAPTEMRTTQIQWTTKPTAGQIVGAYQSCVSMGCLKIAKSKQPEQVLGKLWQRNFWEHIIRDIRAFDTISQYIIMNPAQWEADKLYHVE